MKKLCAMVCGLFMFNNEVISVIALTILSAIGIICFLNEVGKEKGHF